MGLEMRLKALSGGQGGDCQMIGDGTHGDRHQGPWHWLLLPGYHQLWERMFGVTAHTNWECVSAFHIGVSRIQFQFC